MFQTDRFCFDFTINSTSLALLPSLAHISRKNKKTILFVFFSLPSTSREHLYRNYTHMFNEVPYIDKHSRNHKLYKVSRSHSRVQRPALIHGTKTHTLIHDTKSHKSHNFSRYEHSHNPSQNKHSHNHSRNKHSHNPSRNKRS